jgi:hypothetical protein
VVRQQKLRMRGLAQERADACARLAAMNPQVGRRARRGGGLGCMCVLKQAVAGRPSRLPLHKTKGGFMRCSQVLPCLGRSCSWLATCSTPSCVLPPLPLPPPPAHTNTHTPPTHIHHPHDHQELDRLRGELLTLRERAGELAAVRDQLAQERRLGESLQARLAGAQQQLLETRQGEAERCGVRCPLQPQRPGCLWAAALWSQLQPCCLEPLFCS